MFILNIMDDYESVTDSYDYDTMEEVLKQIRHQLKEGIGVDKLQLLKTIDFDVTFEVTVKGE